MRSSVPDEKVPDQIGKLDITSFNLPRIPSEVYSVLLGIEPSNPAPPSSAPASDAINRVTKSFENLGSGSRQDVFGKASNQPETWVECEELTYLKASDNRIEQLDVEIGAFGGLKAIEVGRGLKGSLAS